MRRSRDSRSGLILWLTMVASGCGELTAVDCERGEAGCPCFPDATCAESDEGALACEAGVCVFEGERCAVATEGCPCRADGACAAGLTCTSAESPTPRCQRTPVCPVGTRGCACYDDGTCEADLACESGACFPTGCAPGLEGCACADGDRCEAGAVCVNGACEEDTGQTLAPPATPQCYTPCRGDLVTADGTRRLCSSEGLLEGCIGDTTCVDGSCLLLESPTETRNDTSDALVPSCRNDAQCPEHQACIDGRCYSDCELDSDCRGERRCVAQVCRLPCDTADEASCPDAHHCRSVSGDPERGYCYTLGTTRTAEPPAPTPSVAVSPRRLSFDVQTTAGEITIENTTDRPATYVVRKWQHSEFDDAGREVETEVPMPWLELAAGDAPLERVDSVSFTLQGGETGRVRIAKADNPDANVSDPAFSRWEGILRVQPEAGAPLDVNLGFARSPEGQWTGSLYLLASFGDTGLKEWVANGKSDASLVGNALIRRWQAFKQGRISLLEFLAALSATQNESWRDPLVRERCPSERNPDPDVGCYPSPNPTGISIYSDSLRQAPIPAGVNELPFAINVREAGDPLNWVGRIVSDEALHYGGDPAVELRFGSDPESCGADRAACVTPLVSFAANLRVGGRYVSDSSDLFCNAAPSETFALTEVPWLVPGFLGMTETDPTTGRRVRYECRDRLLPFGEDPNVQALNASLSQANPVPDGSSRKRQIRLLDGALINQDTIFILFEETFDSFLDPSDTEGFSAFGYILLNRSPLVPDSTEYAGSFIEDDRVVPSQLATSCTSGLLDEVLADEPSQQLSPSNVSRVGLAMVRGVVPASENRVPIGADEVPHYLCWATGQFDGFCPPWSDVTYFTLTGPNASAAAVAALPCQAGGAVCEEGDACATASCAPMGTPGVPVDPVACGGCATGEECLQPCEVGQSCASQSSCDETMLRWLDQGTNGIRLDPYYGCDDSPSECTDDPANLLADKTFYTTTDATYITENSPEKVHYLCLDTGYIDDHHIGTSGQRVDTPCPTTSQVVFFTLTDGPDPSTLACQTRAGQCHEGEPCSRLEQSENCSDEDPFACGDLLTTPCSTAAGQACPSKGSCEEQVATWRTQGAFGFRQDLAWECENGDVFCDDDRFDLRAGKRFYTAFSPSVVFSPIDDEVEQAFRYKTRFRTRDGINIGFAPEICIPGSNDIPYCYEPGRIEAIAERVDCATSIYTDYYGDLSPLARGVLKDFLQRTFSFTEVIDPTLPTPVTFDGFEKLRAELLVMLGDESLTRAFASRFDVEGLRAAAFPGAALEPGGINLSGGAGFEMFSLYQATQYYQLALDRLYSQGPAIWSSLDPSQGPPVGEGFITQGTVVSYFSRLVRASTKKAEAWSEIAKRYQFFNRPELARLVIRRAFTAAYLESITFVRLMRSIVEVSSEEDRAQIERELDLGQRRYSKALRTMGQVFSEITDEDSFFGISTRAIPFPPLDRFDINAFEKRLEVARERLDAAAAAEERALNESREFETDSALFQSELSRVGTEFQTQIGEICGTFVGSDGQVYPAIAEYKELDERLRTFGDPCGMNGNGELYQAGIELANLRTDVDILKARREALIGDLEGLDARARAQCERLASFRDWRVEKGEEIIRLGNAIDSLNIVINGIERAVAAAGVLAGLVKCDPPTAVPPSIGECPSAVVGASLYLGVAIAGGTTQAVSESVIAVLRDQIEEVELDITEREIIEECEALRIETNFEISERLGDLPILELEALELQRKIEAQRGVITALVNQAAALEASFQETQSNLIAVEAARNDPNVRIFRNGAVIDADRKFLAALREAFRLTRIYEYFTSQTYAGREDLLLIRLANRGENTLDQYLRDLEEAFDAFEDQFGNPDVRLQIVSLRDDILDIPRLDDEGRSLTEDARLALFREAMADPRRRDARGYVTVPFSTSLDALSPLTRNHKIRFVEAEIVEQEPGDELGRVYLRQRGTGVVRSVDNELRYTVLPPRTAVVNTFFNGQRLADPIIYRSERLRDFPLVNTGWDFVLNLRDEAVNDDVRVDRLKDVVLYLYYTDFTAF